MTIRKKVLFFLALILTCAYLLLFVNSKYILLDSYKALEEEYMQINLNRAHKELKDEITALQLVNVDWAHWDDTYKFIQNGNKAYMRSCLSNDEMKALKLNALIFVNSQGTIIWSQGWDLQSESPATISPNLIDMVIKKQYIYQRAMTGENILGLTLLPENPMIISAMPILPSSENGPAAGILLMGRYLDKYKIQELNNKLHLSFSLIPWNPNSNSTQHTAQIAFSKGQKSFINPSGDEIKGATLLRDIYDNPVLLLEAKMARNIYERGQRSITNFAFFLLLIFLIAGILLFCAVDRVILSRISGMVESIASITLSGNLSTRLQTGGNDELTVAMLEINRMLDRIEHTQLKLGESKEQYRRLFDDALSANFVATIDGQLLLCNDTYMKLFGFNSIEEALHTPITTLYSSREDREELLKMLKKKGVLSNQELVMMGKNGNHLLVLSNIRGIFDTEGKLSKIQGYIVDLTEYDRAQQEIKYLSLYDKLTGLYNRAFFEGYLVKFNQPEYLPLSLIVGDVNGLKMVNDALGHTYGDKLLIKVAEIIQNSCRANDIVARWGGDEFVILLPCTPEDVTAQVCEKIKQSVYNLEIGGIQVSISLGTSTRLTLSQELKSVLIEAEERMYRNKLLQQRSNRNALISTLGKTLQSRSYETNDHAQRLRDMVSRMGNKLTLPVNDMDELELLATLHDIGKVAIPDHILKKPGPLSADEWEIMKKHSEIGFRIAQSTPEMAPIAEAILTHHERWDGTGYPLGLKGEEIPLISRIVAIADAYDVMTEGRPYKERISAEEAIAEIRRCSGTQFDPHLVEIFIENQDELII